jgi:hypothetical protein
MFGTHLVSHSAAHPGDTRQGPLNPQVLGSNPRGRTLVTCAYVPDQRSAVTEWSRRTFAALASALAKASAAA